MEKLILPDLTRLTLHELASLHGDIMENIYQQTIPIRKEMWERMQEEKKKEEEQNLKKAS